MPTAQNTILGLEKQVLWWHSTPERAESDSGTHFKNNLINTWAKEHGIEWFYHIPYHAPASGKTGLYKGLLKITLKAMGGGTFRNWDKHLAQATWVVDTRGSISWAGLAQSDLLRIAEEDKVPVVHERNTLGKTVWVVLALGKANRFVWLLSLKGLDVLGGWCWGMVKSNAYLKEIYFLMRIHDFEPYDVNCCIILTVFTKCLSG